MAEIAAIDVLGRVIELRHRLSHGASHAGTDDQGNEFDDRKEDMNPEQNVFDAAGDISQRCKQMSVENRRPGSHHYKGASPRTVARRPIDYRQWRAKGDLPVHHARRRVERTHGKGRAENLFVSVRAEGGLAFVYRAPLLPGLIKKTSLKTLPFFCALNRGLT